METTTILISSDKVLACLSKLLLSANKSHTSYFAAYLATIPVALINRQSKPTSTVSQGFQKFLDKLLVWSPIKIHYDI